MLEGTQVAPWFYWTKNIMIGINIFSIIGIVLLFLIILSNEFKKKTNIILISLIVFLGLLLFLNIFTDIIQDGLIDIFYLVYKNGFNFKI